MERYFALDMPALQFLRNTLVASVLGLVPVLALYVALTPGFGAMLLAGGPALSLFLRQVLTNGLPVVFVVNYFGFFLFAWITATRPPGRGAAAVLLLDLPVRLAVFVLLHAVIYLLSADWFGSFGGSRATALRVVPPTLARSAMFENLSGVYLYATMISALPLYAAAFERMGRLRGALARFPGRSGPVLLAVALFGLFALALTGIATAATGLR
jgi:hypothetical protein